jgi:hypothetical protein
MPKGIGTGILAGVIVWGVLFLPIHYYVIQPALSSMAMTNGFNPGNLDSLVANQLIQLSDVIILGSLALHLLFGGVMGFCSRLSQI